MEASLRKPSALRLSQAMERSTIQRRLRMTKPLCRSDRLTILGVEKGEDAGQGPVKDRLFIGAIGEQFSEKGEQAEQGRQQRKPAVAVLNVAGGDDCVQQRGGPPLTVVD